MPHRHLSALVAFLLGSCASQPAIETPPERERCSGRKFTGEARERKCFEIEHDVTVSDAIEANDKPGG